MGDTTALRFDARATSIIAEHHGQWLHKVLRLDIDRTYGRGGPYYLVRLRWTMRTRVEKDPGLVCTSGPCGVHVFIERRLWRYLAWHPLRVHGFAFGPFRHLVPEAGPCFIDDLRAWEATHPTVGLTGSPAA